MAADGKTPPTHPQGGGAGTSCVHVVSLCADTKTMTCRPCLDTYIHTYKQTINQYKQIVIIHKSIETYSYTYTWLQMVRPPQPTHRGGAGTLCVHVVSLCADTKTMTCRPCWDTHILTYQQTDRQTHRHTYINQYKHIVIPIHGCICVTYPPFGGGVGGNQGGLDHIYIYIIHRIRRIIVYLHTGEVPKKQGDLCPHSTNKGFGIQKSWSATMQMAYKWYCQWSDYM